MKGDRRQVFNVSSSACSGESSPAFPGLVRVRVFWPFVKKRKDCTRVRPNDSKIESGLESDLSSPKLEGKPPNLTKYTFKIDWLWTDRADFVYFFLAIHEKFDKTTNLDLILDFFCNKKNNFTTTDQVEKQVCNRFESWAKDSNLFFLPQKSPKDSNPRTRVRRFDSPLVSRELESPVCWIPIVSGNQLWIICQFLVLEHDLRNNGASAHRLSGRMMIWDMVAHALHYFSFYFVLNVLSHQN
jgi:uncharacterized protein YktA (UPF0223 family)